MNRIFVEDIDEIIENLPYNVYESVMKYYLHYWGGLNDEGSIPTRDEIKKHIEGMFESISKGNRFCSCGGFDIYKNDNCFDIVYENENFEIRTYFEVRQSQNDDEDIDYEDENRNDDVQEYEDEYYGDDFIVDEDENVIDQDYKNVEVDLDEITFMYLANLAHEQNITLNELCNRILEETIKRADDED